MERETADAGLLESVSVDVSRMENYMSQGDTRMVLQTVTQILKKLDIFELNKSFYRAFHFQVCKNLDTLLSWLCTMQYPLLEALDIYKSVQLSQELIPRLYLMIVMSGMIMNSINNEFPEEVSNIEESIKIGDDCDFRDIDVELENLDKDRFYSTLLEVIQEDIYDPPMPVERVSLVYAKSSRKVGETLGQSLFKCILDDMALVMKGAQNPTCGILLRHYQLYIFVPYINAIAERASSEFSICALRFLMGNFIEMNKLWVRLRHEISQDEYSSEESKVMEPIILFNISALALFPKINEETYKRFIFPCIAREIVSCGDSKVQKCIMKGMIHKFPAKFHACTLQEIFFATLQFNEDVKVEKIIKSVLSTLVNHLCTKTNSNADFLPSDIELNQAIITFISQRLEVDITKSSFIFTALVEFFCKFYPESSTCLLFILNLANKFTEAICQCSDIPDYQIQDKIVQPLSLILKSPNFSLMFVPNIPEKHRGKIKSPGIEYQCLKIFTHIVNMLPVSHAIDLNASLAQVFIQLHHKYGYHLMPNDLFSIFLNTSKTTTYEQPQEKLKTSTVVMLIHITNLSSHKISEVIDYMNNLYLILAKGYYSSTKFVIPVLVYKFIELVRIFGRQSTYSELDEMFKIIILTINSVSPRALRSGCDIGNAEPSAHKLPRTRSNGVQNVESVAIAQNQIHIELLLGTTLVANDYRKDTLVLNLLSNVFYLIESQNTCSYLALVKAINTLYSLSILSIQHYESFAIECVEHCSKIDKKFNRCTALVMASHLFWRTGEFSYTKPAYLTQCLRKAATLAATIGPIADKVDALTRVLSEYIWYSEKNVSIVTAGNTSKLMDEISKQLSLLSNTEIGNPAYEKLLSANKLISRAKKILGNLPIEFQPEGDTSAMDIFDPVENSVHIRYTKMGFKDERNNHYKHDLSAVSTSHLDSPFIDTGSDQVPYGEDINLDIDMRVEYRDSYQQPFVSDANMQQGESEEGNHSLKLVDNDLEDSQRVWDDK